MENLRPPPGGDANKGTTFIVIAVLFASISMVTTVLRIGVRVKKSQLGWDDCAIAIATILLLVQAVFNGLQYHAGDGRHTYYLGLSKTELVLKWSYITEFFLFIIICVTKISICLFVLRIKNTGWLKWFLYSLMVGLVATTGVCEVVLFAQCRPIRTFWDRTAGTCWDPAIYNKVIWAQVAYSIFSDLVCSFLPVVVLWNIKIPARLKIAVCGLMSLGLLATVCAAVRASLSENDKSIDLTWTLINISVWGALEENLGIICANLALSRTVYIFFRHGPRASTKSRYEYQPPSSRKHPAAPRKAQDRSHSFSSRSQDTMIPTELEAITKTTDVHISYDTEGQSSYRRDRELYDIDGHAFGDRV